MVGAVFYDSTVVNATQKALGALDSGDSLRASLPSVAAVLTSSAVVDRASPFQSARNVACRAGRNPVFNQRDTLLTLDALTASMKVRGERECSDCGARWSYYETGEITCPDCGSIRSVGVGERTEHTAGTATLDLSAVKAQVETEDLRTLADEAAGATREYLRSAGFVHAGSLQPLSDTYLAASELRRVATTLGRVMQIDDDEELYFYDLLRGADQDERPEPGDVPETLHPERGLAVAASVERYVRDVRRVYEECERAVDSILEGVTARRKRIEALDGDVDPAEAESLVLTLRDLSAYLRDDDEAALARAQERL